MMTAIELIEKRRGKALHRRDVLLKKRRIWLAGKNKIYRPEEAIKLKTPNLWDRLWNKFDSLFGVRRDK